MTATNLVSYSAQVAILVAVCAALPRMLGLRSPGLQYVFWRVLLGVCLILPVVEPWHQEQMVFVAAPAGAAHPVAGQAPAASHVPLLRRADWIAIGGVLLIAGACARLIWLAIGAFRLRRLRHDASDPSLDFIDLQEAIGTHPPILWSERARHPVTFGIVRPVVVLPASLRAADVAAQRAVVAHELHHVKRRDWAWIVSEEIVRSIFWFHPAMWWLVSRVQLARETVVDELSILTTNARRAYLDTLLAFADDTGLASTPAFSARRHLFHRVMLLSKEGNMSSIRIAVGACALVIALATGSWGAVHALPLTHTVVSIDHDQNLPAEQAQPPATRLTPGQLPPPPPPQSARPMPPPPPPAASTNAQAEPPMPEEFKAALDRLKPVRLGKTVKPAPATTKTVKAAYPDAARAAGIQGEVTLETIIDADGKVAAVRVIRSVPGLDEAAIDAARQWEFTPALLNGTPTPVLTTMVMNFRLK